VARPVSPAVPAAPAPGRRRAPQRSSGDANKCLTVVSGGQGWMASATDGGDGGDERQSPHLGPSMEAAEPARAYAARRAGQKPPFGPAPST
jgi:hypothetical protein